MTLKEHGPAAAKSLHGYIASCVLG